MSIIRTTPVSGPAVWTGAEIAGSTEWLHHLTEDEIAVIDAGLAALEASGRSFPGFGKGDFPLEGLSEQIAEWAEMLENGRGFVLLRGLPVERYTEEQIHALYYGLGLHLGQPVGQNPKGELIGAVQAVGDPNDKLTRTYETASYLPYHSDPSDVVGLLCLRKAAEGGLSSLVSVAALYNKLLAEHPHLMGLFYKLWYFAHLCEDEPSLSPIFSYHAGKLSCRYLRQYTELGHELRNLPLSTVEIEALDTFDAAFSDPSLRLDMMLEPGDIQFANNYAVLHSRTDFRDHEDPQQRRKMLRLWVKMPNARELAPEFPGRNGFPVPELVG